MAMNRWFNPSHPQTLQAAVFLGYLSAVFGLLGSGFPFLLLFLGLGAGAFGSANNKRWGYALLAACSVLIVLLRLTLLLIPLTNVQVVASLDAINGMVFPVALAAAVLHAHSREYQKVWFE